MNKDDRRKKILIVLTGIFLVIVVIFLSIMLSGIEGEKDSTPPPAPMISSSTHPDENNWYNDTDVTFSWTTPSDPSGIKGYSYVLDHSELITPEERVITTSNSQSYPVNDGIWYFHVRAKDNAGNWGETSHYKIKIDATPPLVEITEPKEGGIYFYEADVFKTRFKTSFNVGPLTIAASANDSISNVYVEFYIDEQLKDAIHSPPYIWRSPMGFLGLHTIKVIAYDEAGNSAADSVKILSIPF
jgi:hypothetical protein